MGRAKPQPDRIRSLYERRSSRVPVNAEVSLRRSGALNYRVHVFDASPLGCKLEFVERPRLDETVWVKFEGYDAIQSTVCWVEGHTVGVEFERPIYPSIFEMMIERLTS